MASEPPFRFPFSSFFPLFPVAMEFAELIKTPRADNAVLHGPRCPAVRGTLCLTGHHLIFSSRRKEGGEELWLLHANIDCVEKR